MPLENSPKIDQAQIQLDQLDGVAADQLVLKDGKDYADRFLTKVDQFQTKLESWGAPKDIREAQLQKLLEFLEEVDADNIEKAASALNKSIDEFIATLDIFDKKNASYAIQAGDSLSKIAPHCFDKEGVPLSWEKLYEANKALLGDDPNRIFPGQKLDMPEGYGYFPEIAGAPVLVFESQESADKPKKNESFVGAKDIVIDTNLLPKEPLLETEKARVDKALAEIKVLLPEKASNEIVRAYDELVRSGEKSPQEFLENLQKFSASLEEIKNEVEKGETVVSHGEIEKTIVRVMRKVPFLANFTPVGMVLGLTNSVLGTESATAKQRAIEGTKFIASIIPIAGNLVDITDGIYGLITGKRIGSGLTQSTGESLFSIGIGIGGMAIDILTAGTLGAPIKALLKALIKGGEKGGAKILAKALLKEMGAHLLEKSGAVFKKPLTAVADIGRALVVEPVKFVKGVFYDAPRALVKNRKAIVSGAANFIKHPIATSKEAVSSVVKGIKVWWNEGGGELENGKEKASDKDPVRGDREQKALDDLRAKDAELTERITTKEKERDGLTGDKKKVAGKELIRLGREQKEIRKQITKTEGVINALATEAAAADLAVAKKKKDMEDADKNSTPNEELSKIADELPAREAFLREVRSLDISSAKTKELERVVTRIDSEIARIDAVLENTKTLSSELRGSLERQKRLLGDERAMADLELQTRALPPKPNEETAKTEPIKKDLMERFRELSDKISDLLENLKSRLDVRGKMEAVGKSLKELKEKIPTLPDLNLRQKFSDRLRAFEERVENIKGRLRAKKNPDEIADTPSLEIPKPNAFRVGEEVYVKRTNGTVERGWVIEKINPDGKTCDLQNGKLRREGTPLENVWTIDALEKRRGGDLREDEAALLIQRKFEVLNKHTTLTQKEFSSLFLGPDAIKQQNVGNCYFIASLNGMRESPHFEAIIRTSMKRVVGGWEVKIPLGSPTAKPVKITPADLGPQKNPLFGKPDETGAIDQRKLLHPVDASLGYQILEAAFIKYKNGGILDRTKIEGGFGHRALLDLLGDNFSKRKISSGDVEYNPLNTNVGYSISSSFDRGTPFAQAKLTEFLDDYDSAKYIATVNTPPSVVGDRGRFKVGEIEFATGHAYSIVAVDKFRKEVAVANPWNTGEKIVLSYDEFMRAFNQVSAVRVSYKDLLENFEKIAAQKAA